MTRHDSAIASTLPHELELRTADGFRLAATRYPAQGALRGRVVVAAATAVPRGFYRRFANYASERGFDCLTFDYRGIGGSRPASLKGFRMNLLDWGRQDMAAAVDAMADGKVPLFVVGHSYAGHGFGLMPNHHKVSGFQVFGTGAAWHGWMPLADRLKVRLFWHLLGPLTWLLGYCPGKRMGLGEDLPADAFRQWRRWAGMRHYFFDDPQLPELHEHFAAVTTPIVAVNALDDAWSLPASRDALMHGYRNAPITRLDPDPKTFGRPIGHMGYFRQGAEPLWDDMLTWFASLATPEA